MVAKYFEIIKKLGSKAVKTNESLSIHTTFKIGGPADLFYEATTEGQLIEAVKLALELKIPFFILGAGSNVLISDEGFKGLVIKVKNEDIKIVPDNSDYKITAGAGVSLSELRRKTAALGIAGLEFSVGIPGTVGGAVRGNAGAWQQSIGDRVSRVKVLTPVGKVIWFEAKDCQFAYRQSLFKKSKNIILAVELVLKAGEKKEIKKTIEANWEKRLCQPTEPSAGCVFINPKPQSAGELIDQCGLKGKTIGGAQISSKHANFIVNLGKAKAKDVKSLIKIVKEKVKKKFGISLEEEICLVGFDRIK